MNKIIIGSFYTTETPYKTVAEKYLIPSCKKLGLEYKIVETFPNYKSWWRNVAEKPAIILDMLSSCLSSDECLVFLDADAEILQYPKLLFEIPKEYDISFHTLSWEDWYGYPNSKIFEILSGTIFLRNRKNVKELCKEWYSEAIKTNIWEQKVLERIINNHNLNIFPLPIEYCYMRTRPNGEEPLVKCEPIIAHNQVSREMKRKIR